MGPYTIKDFWLGRLGGDGGGDWGSLVAGWSCPQTGLRTFREAPLTLSAEFGDLADPQTSSLLLVSAPGAVGKSTLARQLAYATGSIYIDLAAADPVGANTLSGGLAKSGLYDAWQSEAVTALIDGLDEARLKVTQEAFWAFLTDVAELAAGRSAPTVLFGRTGAIQDAWLALADDTIGSVAVLEIGYYDQEGSVAFAEDLVRELNPQGRHSASTRDAIDLILMSLRRATESDGDRFAGYAPVLQAVAKHVAGEGNPAALVSNLKRGEQPVTLQTIVSDIMVRERGKLDILEFHDSSATDELYAVSEQLDRLVARVYGGPQPPPPDMHPKDVKRYQEALKTWVDEHPFLDGASRPSSTVFGAAIASRALRDGANEARAQALREELFRGAAANPFLAAFYLDGVEFVDPDHIGIIYASVRAGLSLGEAATLSIDSDEDMSGDDELFLQADITVSRRDVEEPRVSPLVTHTAGPILFGSQVEDVEVVVPGGRVEVGAGPEVLFIAPVTIECGELRITSEKVIVEASPEQGAAGVLLEARSFEGNGVADAPMLRGGVDLSVWWPGANHYPWNGFANEPTQNLEDPALEEALRRFRRFVVACRSHKRRGLARYMRKIEHTRMIKGSGQSVLDLMVAEKILILERPMYFLDAERLYDVAGTSYGDCVARRFGEKAMSFVRRAIEGRGN